MLERKGEQFTATARTLGQPIAAPVDATVAVPDVEVLGAADAAKRVTAAGLVPSYVDGISFATLTTPPAPETLVTRQGVPAGERLLAGSTLMLATEGVATAPSLGEVPQTPVPIDVNDGLGFARVRGSGLVRAPMDESHLSIEDSDRDQSVAAAVLLLDADPGVSLDPSRAVERKARAALLKQLLAALARQPRGGELPGIVGKAIAAGTAAGEEQFAVAVAAGQQLNPADVGAVFEAVSRELNVDLNVVERQALHDDWSRYIVGRRTATWLDRNENSQLADDSAAWMIGWLFEQGKFDPLTVTIVTPPADGGPPLATFPEQPQVAPAAGPNPQPNLDSLLGLLLPGKPNVIVPPGPQGDSKPPPPPVPPTGPPLVTKGDGPDFVRVPSSSPDLISEVLSRFRDLGLRIAGQASCSCRTRSSLPIRYREPGSSMAALLIWKFSGACRM